MPSPDKKEKHGEGVSSSPSIDWGEIFGDIVNHTSITHREIPYLTLPQINEYRRSIGKNIPLKVYGPSILDSTNTNLQANQTGPPTVSQFAAMANFFNGIMS